jgi:hypothetical protein
MKRTVEELNNLPSFIAWLETQDMSKTYSYCMPIDCLAFRYFNEISGNKVKMISPCEIFLTNGEHIPLNGDINRISRDGNPFYDKALKNAKNISKRKTFFRKFIRAIFG